MDGDLCTHLKKSLKGTPEAKLEAFSTIAYDFCMERFGVAVSKKAGRSQLNLGGRLRLRLSRSRRKAVRRRWNDKETIESEKPGLKQIFEELKKRLSELRKAERISRKKNEQRKCREEQRKCL